MTSDSQESSSPPGGSDSPPGTRDGEQAGGLSVIAVLLVSMVATAVVSVALLWALASRSSVEVSVLRAPLPNFAAPAPDSALPPDAREAYGIPLGQETAPTVEVWEDFQCVECQELHAAVGATLASLARKGDIRLVVRPASLWDVDQPTTASLDAAAAWGCAVDEGYGEEFRRDLLSDVPPSRGTGWSLADFLASAARVGMTDEELESFESCVALGRYRTWVVNSTGEFFRGSAPQMPWVVADAEAVPLIEDIFPMLERFGFAIRSGAAN